MTTDNDKTKNKGGRPRKYESVAEMQKAIDEYFNAGNKTTICGLALHLGFNSRQSLLNYEGYGEEFLDTIKHAKSRIEAYYEEHLTEPNVAGSIFALKNFGWKDKIEADITSDGKPIAPQIIVFGTPTKADDNTD